MSIHPTAFIHESAIVLGAVNIGAGASVWPCAVVRGDTDRIEIGENTNIQDGAVIHCDDDLPCIIGKRVTVGHRAVVHAAVVRDGALIGIGALVLNGAHIGEGALIGAGAVVTEGMEVPPHTLVLGVPARVKGPLTPEQRARVAKGWESYVAMAARHRAGYVDRHRAME